MALVAGALGLVSTGPRTGRTGPVRRARSMADGGAVNTRAEEPPDVPSRLAYSVEEAATQLGIGRTFMFQLDCHGRDRVIQDRQTSEDRP